MNEQFDIENLPENFGGNCMLLQRQLRRLAALKGEKVEELTGNRIRCEVGGNNVLTLYGAPKSFGDSPLFYGDIFYPSRLYCQHEYINERCAQALYEELNKAIQEMGSKRIL